METRIATRDRIEELCRRANSLPVHKKILFHLYFRDGYSTIEIAQLLMIHPANVGRRLAKIKRELELIEVCNQPGGGIDTQ